ncbi:hypothetical protein [Pygmaiobacter massiliensis]|uniref:hypothetical protein n=1 Tax=Pygmaiobacter massiliensis TaxID=1917873 RepID=UPI000C7E5C6B|nr:hypothetical protein [Pygmaiobacter massiliensis]
MPQPKELSAFEQAHQHYLIYYAACSPQELQELFDRTDNAQSRLYGKITNTALLFAMGKKLAIQELLSAAKRK